MIKELLLRGLFLFLLVCSPQNGFCVATSWQQTSPYNKFSHISFPFSANTATSACMQSGGMVWFGTRQGLFNYNGYNLHRIPNGDNPASNSVQAIIETPKYLCVGTDNGVFWLNKENYQFEQPYPSLASVGAVRSLLSVGDKLLIGSRDKGLYILNLKTGRLSHIPCKSRPTTLVYSLAYVGNGTVYIGAYEGLSKLNLRNGRHTTVTLPGRKQHTVNSLYYEKKANSLWVGFLDGVMNVQLHTGNTEVIHATQGTAVRSIAEDADGNILMGTDNGLYVRRNNDHSVYSSVHNIHNPFSISNNSIWNILCDSMGNTWLCTEDGISFSQSHSWLRDIQLSSLTEREDGNSFFTMLVDSRGTIWAGGDNGLLCLPEGGQRTFWFKKDNPGYELPINRIRSVYEDREHVIWIATDAGIGHYDPATHRFQFSILHDDRARSAVWTYAIVEDTRGRMWITTYRGGLYVVDRASLLKGTSGIFDSKVFLKYDSITNTIYQAFTDDKGKLWVNSDKGLAEIDMNSMRVSLKNIYMDRMVLAGNTIWLTSQGSIYRYDISTGKKVRLPFQEANGMILTLVPARDRIWFSTARGVYYIDSRDNSIHNSYFTDDAYLSGCYDARSNRLLWGKKNGFDMINLGGANPADKHRHVSITAVTTGDSLLLPADGYVLDNTRKEVRLASRAGISLEVSSFSYAPNNREVLYYRFDSERQWNVLSGGQNKINLSGLGGGSYELQLSSTDPSVDSKAVVTTYTLHVPYPWFLRWYMIVLYTLVFLTLLYIIIRYEQKRNRVRYEEMEKQRVMELSRQKMNFFVNVSHELKTPLSLIIAPVSKLLSESRSANQKHMLQLVYKNALRLNTLIAQILDFKSMEYESDDTLIRSYLDVNALISDCIEDFRTEVESRGIKILFQPGAERICMNLDTVKMESVITNLLSNAIKYVPDQSGVIVVRTALEKDLLTIDIQDNGPGVDDEDLPMIFIRYFQGKNSQKKGGTGIGMYLVRKFVQLHGGTVDAYTNKGLTIHICIPATGDNVIASHKSVVTADSFSHDEENTVLIIDDNTEMVDFLRISLSGSYHCLTASNGQEGLNVAFSGHPDIIIVDEMMPVMDGLDFCSHVRRNPSLADIPIIMLTAKTDSDTELDSIRSGADLFMPKPFNLKKLQLHIIQLLKRSENIRHHARVDYISDPEFKDSVPRLSPSDTSEKFLATVTAIIEENIDDENFNVTVLAEKAGVDSKQLYRKIKQITGSTPIAYLKKLRMKKAAVLLSEHTFSVSEVMYMVGYTNASYFSKCFADEFGVSPKDYLQRCH